MTYTIHKTYQKDTRYPFQIKTTTLRTVAELCRAKKATIGDYNSFDKSFLLFLDGERCGRLSAKEDDYRDKTIGYNIRIEIAKFL